MYHGAEEADDCLTPGFPLLVLQGMLLAACSFVGPRTLEKLGYVSARDARRAMYGRAKTLYNFETEHSRLHIAQAAILLSYWTPPFEEAASKPNAAWLRIAIENAKSVQAHQWNFGLAPKTNPTKILEQISLKRLWGCCIVRDCISAIALRRSCQIGGPELYTNVRFSLAFEDLEHEIHESRVYDSQTKRHLIITFLGFAEMCMYLTDISKLLFPRQAGLSDEMKQYGLVERTTRILECKTTLDRWHSNAAQKLDNCQGAGAGGSKTDGTELIHPSVILFTNLQHIYY